LEHSGGLRAVVAELNKRFWAPNSSMLFQKIAYGCIPCRKRLAKPTKQIMAPLPFYRMPSARLHPFDHSAIDVAGHFQTKIGRSMVKRWLLVICCSTTGAVHLEMIDYMDTSSFLLAVERFLALRPGPSVFIADNGTNFKIGDSALQGITEKGLVEIFVGATKAAIHSAVHAHTLTDKELRTIFSRAMGHLNNVPIAYTVESEADFHYLPLTLGHFLMGSAYAELQPIDKENTKLANATRYNRVCSVLELFWKRERCYTLSTDGTGTDGNGWRNLTDGVFRRIQVLRPSNNEHSGAVKSGRPIM
jgi:hypothetical protein